MNNQKEKKLHLGCGKIYLEGYVNIDYYAENNPVQNRPKVDINADICKLEYELNSISEIRLHHVFEHFNRAESIALLCVWNNWLNNNGILRIEVPDFDRSIKAILNPLISKKKKYTALRHIFGSQEGIWATHFHGYSIWDLKKLLNLCGYKLIKINKSYWKGLYNIDIIAVKSKELKPEKDFLNCANTYFDKYIVDESASEREIKKIWMINFKDQCKNSGIKI